VVVGDTLNTIATSLSQSDIQFVHMRHEEAGAFAAQGEALLMDRLTAVAGSSAPVVCISSMVCMRRIEMELLSS